MKQIVIVAFAILSFVYGLAAHYSFHRSRKDKEGLTVALVFGSFSIWALFTAASLGSVLHEDALMWRKLGALGWGTMYSLMLQHVLQATGRGHLLKHRRTLFMIYLPAAVNLFLFLLYTPVADAQFKLVQLDGMWLNIFTDTAENWYYTVYILVFSAISLGILLHWHRNSTNRTQKRRARLLMYAQLLMLTFSILVHTAVQALLFGMLFVQVLIFIMSIFTLIFLTSLNRYVALDRDRVREEDALGQVLTRKARRQTYHIGGMVLFLLSYLTFFSATLPVELIIFAPTWLGNVLISLLLMAAAQLVYSLDRIQLKSSLQEALLFLVFTVVDIFLFVTYRENGAVTVWAAIILLIVPATVFNSIRLFVVVSIVHLLLLLGSALFSPRLEATIALDDHVWRVVITGTAMAFAFVINRIYRERLVENEEFALLQKAVSEMAMKLSEGGLPQYQERTAAAFEVASRFLSPDVLIPLESQDAYASSLARGVQPLPPILAQDKRFPDGELLFLMAEMQDSVALHEHCIRVTDLPDEAAEIRARLLADGFRSLTFVPLRTNDRQRALLLLSRNNQLVDRQFSHQHEFISTFASILTGFVERLRSEAALEYLAYYDTLTGLLKRERFIQLAEHSLKIKKNAHLVCGLVFFDLNDFKLINDIAGHKAGDEALAAVASLLLSQAAPEDFIGRYGGDEFMVFLRRETKVQIQKAAAAYQKALGTMFTSFGHSFEISASMGIATGQCGQSNLAEMIHRADQSMYQDKQQRKGPQGDIHENT